MKGKRSVKGHDIRATAPGRGVWLSQRGTEQGGRCHVQGCLHSCPGGQARERSCHLGSSQELRPLLDFHSVETESSKHRVREAIDHLEVSLEPTVPKRGSGGGSQGQEGMQSGAERRRSLWEAGLADKLAWSGTSLTVVRVLTSCRAFGLCKKRMFPDRC